MDLQNVLPHMRGKSVKVNGNSYPLDMDGVARGVASEDAAKLLKNRDAWRSHVARTPSAPPKANLAAEAKPAKPEPPKAPEPPAAPAEEPAPPPPPKAEVEPREDELEEVVPDEGEDWPDPEVSMGLGYLRKMADAYEVKWTPKTGKKKIVADIMKAMYPDD